MASPELDNARAQLKKVQDFDVSTLERQEDLGKFNFAAAVGPAARLVELFRRIPQKALDDFPVPILNQVKQFADQVIAYFQQILAFDMQSASNPGQQRTQLIQQIASYYDQIWPTLHPYVSYGAARTADLGRLENEGREAIAGIRKETDSIVDQLRKDAATGKDLLDEVRRVAAEQGVSQQAIYFQQEADRHEQAAKTWRTATIWIAVGVGLYAFATMFAHLIPGLDAKDASASAQIITGKVLVFAVLAYMLLLSARNFLAHVHNGIVNRHRQNALLTFKAMTEAGGSPAARDIVLGQAAACIYAPQETGYTRGAPTEQSLPQALVQMITRTEPK